jgi:hypothetical protein
MYTDADPPSDFGDKRTAVKRISTTKTRCFPSSRENV